MVFASGMRKARINWKGTSFFFFNELSQVIKMCYILMEDYMHLKNSSTVHIKYGYFIEDELHCNEKLRGKINLLKNILRNRKFYIYFFRCKNWGPECSGNFFKFTVTGGCTEVKSGYV